MGTDRVALQVQQPKRLNEGSNCSSWTELRLIVDKGVLGPAKIYTGEEPLNSRLLPGLFDEGDKMNPTNWRGERVVIGRLIEFFPFLDLSRCQRHQGGVRVLSLKKFVEVT